MPLEHHDSGPGDPPGFGLYVHVPFCVRKCPYCAFASAAGLRRAAEWATGIRRETEARAAEWTRPPGTIYVGGGTPSALAPATLGAVLSDVRRPAGAQPDAECTLEANPADVSPEAAAAWQAMGFNRVSVGVQALDDATLAFLGRRHDAATARIAVRMLRDAGFAALGIDLIYGLPNQDADAWRRTLDAAVSLAPDHLSCYALTIEPGTPFAHGVAAGALPVPDEDRVADLFLLGNAVLTAAGFEHYEVSNYALPGRRSRHNAGYWSGASYVGLGPAAHSFDGTVRKWNAPTLDDWLAGLDGAATSRGGHERPTPEQRTLEMLALGLRTSDGIDATLLAPGSETASTVRRLTSGGMLQQRGPRLVPTPRGMLIADAMARALSD